jgi:hypothetical protein
MTTIYKYKLAVVDAQTLELPEPKGLLSVAMQNGDLCLWAEVDPSKPKSNFTILIFGTGHPISEEIEKRYIGTVHSMQRGLVWHVFLKIN